MSIIIQKTKEKLYSFGKSPICNDRPDRAPHIGPFCFPLCWRCSSYLLGVLLFGLFQSVLLNIYLKSGLFSIITIMVFTGLPLIIDGIRQYYFGKESTNRRRILTGILAGLSANMFILIIRLI